MSKKQAKPKKSFKLSDRQQAKLTESSLRKFSDIIDQTIKLTNVEVGDQKNAKDRLRKLMINRVMRDYLSHTQNTYLLSSKEKLAQISNKTNLEEQISTAKVVLARNAEASAMNTSLGESTAKI